MKKLIFGALMLIAGASFGQSITVSNSTGCDVHIRFYIDDAPDVNGCQACGVDVCIPDGTTNASVSISGCGSSVVRATDVQITQTCGSSTPCTTTSGNLISPPGSACPYPQTLSGISTGSCGCGGATFTIDWINATTINIY